MSLRATAAADIQNIVRDASTGGDEIVITSPAGAVATVHGFTSDVHLSIDPGTGEMVSGRKASVAVLIADLVTESFQDIHGVAESTSRPWLVTMTDANGTETTFKVVETNPDASSGLTILFLEEYVAS